VNPSVAAPVERTGARLRPSFLETDGLRFCLSATRGGLRPFRYRSSSQSSSRKRQLREPSQMPSIDDCDRFEAFDGPARGNRPSQMPNAHRTFGSRPASPGFGDLQGATLSGRHTRFAVVAVRRSERREMSEFVPVQKRLQ
jgi:hypothetical protein